MEAELLTLGQVARACGVAPHRAKYAIAEYGIEPRQRAGILRLWAPEQVAAVKIALGRIARHPSSVAALGGEGGR
jgi:hypothetical protein